MSTGLVVLTLGTLPACSSDPVRPAADAGVGASPAPAQTHERQATVLQPGKPGEPARTLPPDATLPAGRYNAADVRFVRMMVPHHTQAVEMGRLARTRAQDPQVRALAARIADAQKAEIAGMVGWLQRHDLDASTGQGRHGTHHGSHRGASMPGMLTPARMDRLAAADGRRFDVLFLRSMIQHHQGALEMAGKVMSSGSDIVIGELATDISAGQSAEIRRMRHQLLRS